ncbi:Transient receptor potential channel, partial [Trichinella pseudospiralis]
MISRRQKAANQVNEWIRERFLKRECFKILPVSTDSEKDKYSTPHFINNIIILMVIIIVFRCGCGRYFASHYYFEEEKDSAAQKEGNRWSVAECTSTFSTDAYGTLRFQGVSRPWKSLYIRMDFTVDPQDMWQLLVHVWGLEPPKLVITIYGGGNDFELNPALWQEFKNGLLKVAKNTSAWIITSGLRVGVVKHVAAALTECTSTKKKQQFALIGIAPWGMVRQSEQLIGQNKCVNYYPFESQRSRFVSLCEGHTCFLMVDNGTVGRSGAEMTVRRHFETFLKQKSMDTSQRLMPIVCLVLGGGRLALHSAVNFVCSSPPVPVVVCKNSGRGADILAYAVEMATESKLKDENLKKLLCDKIKEKLDLEKGEITWWASCLVDCLAHRNLLTVFDGMSVQDDDQQLDCKILNALLTGRNSTSIDRLSLLLTWNREDMLREILERGGDWEESALHSVMMQALMYDHTDFVKLLLQHGVAVDAFLTPDQHCDVGNLTSDSESSDSDSEDDACCTVVLGEETENNLEQQTENAPRPSVKRKRKVSHYIPSPHYPDMQSVEQQQKKHRGTMPHNGYFAKISPTNDPLEFLNDAASSMPNLSPRGTALYSLKLANLNRQNLSVRKKIREFYAAPITAFWSWTLGYLFFLALFTCIVLVKPTKEPYWAEYYILMFVVGFFTDLIRKLLMVDAKDLRSKWTVYSRRQWDRASLFASLIFFIGFGLRVHSNTLDLGRVILKCIIVFYYLRLLTVLTVSSKLGPYITIYGKMVSKMVLLCTILFILLISFGVFRQSLTFPNEEWDWKLIRDIVYKPYFMLYGEVYADEIDTCGDENENCVFFYWLSPLFMTIYLLLSIIVFLNMMIAAFNFVFVTISAHSHLIWKFQKFEQVMDYEKQPFLPPPFVIIVHLYLLVQFLCRRRSKAHRTDMSLSKC